MPTSAVTKRFYPRLSELITVDNLPKFLNFAKNGLDTILGNIHYKNLQYSKTARGMGLFIVWISFSKILVWICLSIYDWF